MTFKAALVAGVFQIPTIGAEPFTEYDALDGRGTDAVGHGHIDGAGQRLGAACFEMGRA